MKNIYSLFTLFLLFFTISLSGQSRVYAPNLRAPESGEAEAAPNVILDWDAVTGETLEITYDVQLAKNEDFSDAFNFPRTDLSAVETEQLLFGEHYFWRVKAFDADEPSGWSESWSFTVTNSVNIKSPKIGKEVYTSQEIKWDEITGLLKYELNVDTSYVWNQVNTETENNVLATFVLNDANMWLVGENGLIQNYNGTFWNTMDAGVTKDINSVYFVDATNGYAVGEDGLILFFDGNSWSTVDAGISVDLNGVSFVDANNGWVVGVGGLILNFSDGVWSEVSTTNNEDLAGVAAVSVTDVWACGDSEVVMHFNGTDWSVTKVGIKDLLTIWFNDASNGWVTGKKGYIHYYNGTEWTEQESGTSKDLYGISMSGMSGFAVGESGTMTAYDGSTWQDVTSSVEEDLFGIWLKDDLGLSGGETGTVIKKSGSGFDSPFNRVYSISKDSVTKLLVELPFGSKIYYRMRAMHSLDTSSWSSPRSMNTISAPDLDKPKDETDNLPLVNLFKWKEYEGASEYYYEISSDPGFLSSGSWLLDSLSINIFVSHYGTEYYWRVKAAHSKDISDWSEVYSFNTVNEVTLVFPEDSAKNVVSCPLYDWEEILGSKEYEIWIDKNPDFSNPVMSVVSENSYQCEVPMDKKSKYFWKVRANTIFDTCSWSQVWSFSTEGFIGIEDQFVEKSLSIYPNPSNGVFSINFYAPSKDETNLTVSDLTGKIIYKERLICNSGENKKEINLENLQKGLYLVCIRKGNEVVTKKLFVN